MGLWYRITTLSSEKKKLIIISSIAVCILAIAITLSIRFITKDRISNYNVSMVASVEEGKNKWEIYKCYDKQLVIVVKNGDIFSKKTFKVEQSQSNKMSLPDFNEIVANDITKKDAYCKSTWEASLGESAQQLKWYDTLGFKIVFKAETQRFIEIYIKNESNEYKRLLITPNQISIADINEFKFNSIEDYIY